MTHASTSVWLDRAGRLMLAVGTLMLLLAVLGRGPAGTGGALLLAGTSVLLPAGERTAKVGTAVAGAALALASLVA